MDVTDRIVTTCMVILIILMTAMLLASFTMMGILAIAAAVQLLHP